MYYTYYLSDNPHFVPSTVFQGGINSTIRGARTLDKTFCPLGGMFQQNVDDNAPATNKADFMVDRGQVILYGENVPNQRLGMFRLIRDTADVGKTNFNFSSMSGFLDPYYSGYTEKPMFACVCSNRTAPIDGGLANVDLTQNDKFLKPLIGHTTIFVPKGVYSVNELADLIEGQMNGKYVNIKSGDRYNDIITQAESDGVYDGSLGTNSNGVYRKANAMNCYGDAFNRSDTTTANFNILTGDTLNNPFLNTPISASGELAVGVIGTTGIGSLTNRATFRPTFNPNANPPQTDDGQNDKRLNCFPDESIVMYMPTMKFNQMCQFWKYNAQYLNFKRYPDLDPSVTPYPYYGSEPHFSRAYRYGVQHYIGSGLQNGLQYKQQYSATNELDNANKTRQFNVNGIPSFNFPADAHPCILPAGLHYKRKNFNYPAYQEPNSTQYGFMNGGYDTNGGGNVNGFASVLGLNYDVMKDGYYLGTPDLSVDYDGERSAFSIGNLHQNYRLPDLDIYGNEQDGSGQACILMKRLADKTGMNVGFIGNNSDEKFRCRDNVRSALRAPTQRVGGIAVYNWAYKTALKLGDISLNKTSVINGVERQLFFESDGGDLVPDDQKGRTLFTFDEFFSTKQKAIEAWNTTLWAKLGFTYENLQDQSKWERTKYYDIPSEESDIDASVVWPSMGFVADDFICYGRTTGADLNPSAAPTVSTAVSAKQYDTYDPHGGAKGAPSAGQVQIQRTFDNHDVNTPYNSFNYNPSIQATVSMGNFMDNNVDLYTNSYYRNVVCVPVITSGKSIIASNLPALSKDGYYIITSDIVDNYSDVTKQGENLPLLGIVPISNLSNQDFLTNKNTLIHTISQPKVVNQVTIKILKPDLTAPQLEENSSVLLQITMPLPPTNPMMADLTEQSKTEDDPKEHPALKSDPRA
jgi:hypothetical protein